MPVTPQPVVPPSVPTGSVTPLPDQPAVQPPVPQPVAPLPPGPVVGSGIGVELVLSSQWNGAFEGQLVLTNQGSTPVNQWSFSFSSRYELRGVSDFSLQQSRQSDGSWLVTLRPPSWGTVLQPGVAVRSYVQGVIPGGGQLASLDPTQVLIGSGGLGDGAAVVTPPPSTPLSPPPSTPSDPLTGAGGSGESGQMPAPFDVLVGSGDTRLQARADLAERFRLGYAWGRQLTIEGFDPLHDKLDLSGFWGEGRQAQVLGSAEGVRVDLPFNQQSVLLQGVGLDQWQAQNLQIWAG